LSEVNFRNCYLKYFKIKENKNKPVAPAAASTVLVSFKSGVTPLYCTVNVAAAPELLVRLIEYTSFGGNTDIVEKLIYLGRKFKKGTRISMSGKLDPQNWEATFNNAQIVIKNAHNFINERTAGIEKGVDARVFAKQHQSTVRNFVFFF
jgi:hypothetical protein